MNLLTAQQEAREKILTEAGCVGPHDQKHRCSALHCDYCGVCDIDIDSILASFLDEIGKETVLEEDNFSPPKHAVYGFDLAEREGIQKGWNAYRTVQKEAFTRLREGSV